MKKSHIFLGIASALFLTGALVHYFAGYLTAAIFGVILGVFLGAASYRVYALQKNKKE